MALSRLSAKQKGFVLVFVPVLFEIAFIAVLAVVLLNAIRDLDRLDRANVVLFHANHIETELSRGILTFIRGTNSNPEQVNKIDNLSTLLDSYGTLAPAKDAVPELKEILADMAEVRVGLVKQLTRLRQVTLDPSIPATQRKKFFSDNDLMNLFMSTGALSQHVVEIERRVETQEPKELARLTMTITVLLVGGIGISIALAIILARLVTDDIVKRMEKISHNAHLIASQKPLLPQVEGTDEIAQLDRVLHESAALLDQAHRKQQAILENAVDIVCSLDAKLRFQLAGAGTAKVWQYEPDDLVGRSMLSLLTKETVEETKNNMRRIAEGGFNGTMENIVQCKDGSTKHSLWTVRWSPEEQSYACVVHDVTALRAIERLKKQFVSIVSHDLRAPLTSIGVGLTLMSSGERGPVTEKIQKTLRIAQSGQARLSELVNELLELDKLESGKMPLDLACVSVSDVCAAAKESLQFMAQKANVRISGPFGDTALLADEGRIVQLITNLLSNAVKFSPADSTVTLSFVRSDDFVRIDICDQGPGIPAERRAFLFDKFSQSTASQSVAIKGTGLGLAIAKAITEAHGGEIGVESELGRGTTFWIKIKRFPDDEETGES